MQCPGLSQGCPAPGSPGPEEAHVRDVASHGSIIVVLAAILGPFQGRAITEESGSYPLQRTSLRVDGPQRYSGSREKGRVRLHLGSLTPTAQLPGPQHPGTTRAWTAAHPGSPTPPQASSLTLAQLGPKGASERAEAELAAPDAGGDGHPWSQTVPTGGSHRAPPPGLAHLGPRGGAHAFISCWENAPGFRRVRREAGIGAAAPQFRQSQGLEVLVSSLTPAAIALNKSFSSVLSPFPSNREPPQ